MALGTLLVCAGSATACSETSGPATAVTLSLQSVDGVSLPTQLRTPGGRLVSVGRGFLQGTNWGHACGFAVGLAEGPLTAVDVPGCRLKRGEERTFTITLSDSRFPAGAHDYRFVP
ncbi:MAG: hypothetical protein ABI681_04615 [Gemmatimonadales bacterium]